MSMVDKLMRLDQRHVLVTGAAGGIGRTIAETCARAGAEVTLLDNRADIGRQVLTEIQGRVPEARLRFVEADLSDLAATKACVESLIAAQRAIDIVVNNAGVNPVGPVDQTPLDVFERIHRINALSGVAILQATLPAMKARRSGAVVNIASVTFNGGWKDFSAYVASKGAMVGLTRSLARELGPWNIRVNSVHPGAIPTALETEVWGDRIGEYTAFLMERQALQMRPTTEDVAHAVLFLASDASRFITGQSLIVDGGIWMGGS